MQQRWLLASLILLYPTACRHHPQTSKGIHPVRKIENCHDMCGEGTRCVREQCRVDYSQDVCGIAWRAAQETNKLRSAITSWGECKDKNRPIAKFVPIDDSKIPLYDTSVPQQVDMSVGTEKLSDDVLQVHMHELEHAINECLSTAACYRGQSLVKGSVDLRFRVANTGTVESVSCNVSDGLDIYGIIPCARKAVSEYEFPSFDGPSMTVDYQINLK